MVALQGCFNTLHCLATSGSLWQPGKGRRRKNLIQPLLFPPVDEGGPASVSPALYIAPLNYLRGAPVMERQRRMISLEG